ncbi:MAG: hypothetical protein LBN34_07180 [Clostridiales Family XIII bacterium]|nr:hypothetical protein [Clostridiales Family XIII bacterium]
MEITIEMVERLMSKTNISYEEAKSALEAADGNLLDAVIALEKDGKVIEPAVSETCTAGSVPVSVSGDSSGSGERQNGGGNDSYRGDSNNGYKYSGSSDGQQFKYRDESTDAGDFLRKFWDGLLQLFHASMRNHFHVVRHGSSIIDIPVLVLVILLIAFFWVTLPLLAIGLFFGFRYKFWGPDYSPDEINKVMDSAAKVADDIKDSVKGDN